MTKIEEIKERIILEGGYTDYEECIDLCMKEYAEFYAKKVLEIAAGEARLRFDGDIFQPHPVSKILNMKLPKHE
jgi:hypothetical protein